jgi:hypothetical protein
VELYLHSPSTSSWRDAQLKHRDSFTFYFISDLSFIKKESVPAQLRVEPKIASVIFPFCEIAAFGQNKGPNKSTYCIELKFYFILLAVYKSLSSI